MAKLKSPKFIFVVGGVLSGVGKGVTCASLGAILKAKGFSVTAIKADPYVNIDAGTMNPVEHGEVFVTGDADETDQDMGNYERFLNVELGKDNYMTTGRVYLSVIERERALGYKGKCVEVVPDVPNEIVDRIERAAKKASADFTLVEIGGTVGEYQNILFLEAARFMRMRHPGGVAIVLVSYLPVPSHLGEMKTKPTQNAARALNSAGLQADLIIARGPQLLDEPRRQKLALFCGLPAQNCLSAPDVSSIYQIPALLESQNAGNLLLKSLGMHSRPSNLSDWDKLNRAIQNGHSTVKIAVVGKYFGSGNFTLADSYISVIEAIKHAAWTNKVKPELTWIDAETYETDPSKLAELKKFDGVLVPGGFGSRGVEGIIKTIEFVRTNKIPYFGICYGMQLACIEFARNVLKLKAANTLEVDPATKYPIIHINSVQASNVKNGKYGGSMRLGSYDCKLTPGSLAHKAYRLQTITERHRHRYELNNSYRDALQKSGLKVSGLNPQNDLVEIVELPSHPFFIGVQFHPEFLSRPFAPHPIFNAFIKASLG